MKKTVMLLTILLIVSVFFSACEFGEENVDTEDLVKDNIDDIDDVDNIDTLFDLELTEREIAFIEDLTNKEFESLKPDDLKRHKTVSVVGDHVVLGEYNDGCSPTKYEIGYESYEVGSDYSDCVYLLQYFPEIKNLSIYLNFNLQNVDFLKNCTNIETLLIYGTRVEDLTVLKELPNLKEVSICQSPVSSLEFHPDAKIEFFTLFSTLFGDLSVIEDQTQMNDLLIYDSLVPITNTQVLSKFDSLDTLIIIAPECDYSFFKDMTAAPGVIIGGSDNIDLSVLQYLLPKMDSFQLWDSDGTDLTPLDLLPDRSKITLINCNPGVRGEKTAEGAEYLTERNSQLPQTFPYYVEHFPEFLPEEFR